MCLMNLLQLLSISAESTSTIANISLVVQWCVLGSHVCLTVYYWKDLSRFRFSYNGLCAFVLPYHSYATICDIFTQTKAGITPKFTGYAVLAVLVYGIGATPVAFAAGPIVPYDPTTAPVIGGGTPQETPDTSSHGEGHGIAEGAGGGAGGGSGGPILVKLL